MYTLFAGRKDTVAARECIYISFRLHTRMFEGKNAHVLYLDSGQVPLEYYGNLGPIVM